MMSASLHTQPGVTKVHKQRTQHEHDYVTTQLQIFTLSQHKSGIKSLTKYALFSVFKYKQKDIVVFTTMYVYHAYDQKICLLNHVFIYVHSKIILDNKCIAVMQVYIHFFVCIFSPNTWQMLSVTYLKHLFNLYNLLKISLQVQQASVNPCCCCMFVLIQMVYSEHKQ